MIRVRKVKSELRCAICHGPDENDLMPCHRCHAMTHTDCYAEVRHCPTFGCVELETLADLIHKHGAYNLDDLQDRDPVFDVHHPDHLPNILALWFFAFMTLSALATSFWMRG